MAEYVYNAVQTVPAGGNVAFIDSIPCRSGNVYHRTGSGLFTLKANTPNAFARYRVTFNGNIAVPTDGTVGPIALALALDGEPIATSRAIVTPAAVDEYFNVTSTAEVTIPRGCCTRLAVENVPASDTAEPAPINAQNVNLVITRTA